VHRRCWAVIDWLRRILVAGAVGALRDIFGVYVHCELLKQTNHILCPDCSLHQHSMVSFHVLRSRRIELTATANMP